MVGRARRSIFALYLASAVFVTVQRGVVGRSNNFKVFRAAAVNLVGHRDLYAAHPDQHFDFYKYSPTFALLFAPFAALPFALALLIWSLLNSLLLVYAVRRLLPDHQATLALALVYLEVLFALQYTQSNGLVTALILLAFVALEEGRQLRAALLIGLDTFIKIFPLGAAALALFHARRWRFALLLAAVAVGLALLPLMVIPPHELIAQYRSWWTIEMSDASRVNRGDSVMQYLYRWFGADWPNWPVQLAGTALLLAPLALERAHWNDRAFRLRFLCSLLVYLVLFNHQSERASFVIAYTGLFVWYAVSAPDPLRNTIALAGLAALLLQDVQLLPWAVHDALGRYRVKGIPCLVAWLVMQAELLGWRRWSPRSHRPEVGQADVSPPEPLPSR
jgi:Glycosyltransferase family 87